jgi:AcrR family transcriptional regulator
MIERDAPAAQAGAAEAEPEQRRRLTPDDRRRQIVDGAIDYFAEVGFDGGTRNLAARLGVTQPLLYRYFPAKEDLMRAVYKRLAGRLRAVFGDASKISRMRLGPLVMQFWVPSARTRSCAMRSFRRRTISRAIGFPPAAKTSS